MMQYSIEYSWSDGLDSITYLESDTTYAQAIEAVRQAFETYADPEGPPIYQGSEFRCIGIRLICKEDSI